MGNEPRTAEQERKRAIWREFTYTVDGTVIHESRLIGYETICPKIPISQPDVSRRDDMERTEEIPIKMGLIPDYEIRLAQELCVAMGECSATYYIVLLLEERQKLEAEIQRLQEDAHNLKSPVHRICTQNLTETLAAALEQSQRAERAEAELATAKQLDPRTANT